MLRAAFILESEDSASAYYRVLANVRAFEREGVDVYPMIIPGTRRGRRRMFDDLDGFDVVVLARRLVQPWEFARLRHRARVLGYDFDDALCYRDSQKHGHFSLSRRFKFHMITRGADFVTAGNAYLAMLSGKTTEDVRIIPTPVDTEVFVPVERPDGPVRIGWTGSKSTLRYLVSILPAVAEVVARHPEVTLTVVSDAFPEKRPFIRTVPWERAGEPAEVAAFDVGVMPLPDNVWTRGKCGFKLLLYGACGVASVASPVGANREIVEEGRTGLLAEGHGEWVQALLSLVEDAEFRVRMGRAARARMESEYSTAQVVRRWAGVLKEMARRKHENQGA